MSDTINFNFQSQTKSDESDLSQISFSITVPSEKIFCVQEMLGAINEGNKKEIAENIIRLIVQEESECLSSALLNDFEETATFLLGEFGIPAHTKGYRYLKEAIVLVAQKPLLVDGITKSLYPAIANIHGTTSSRVERVVRHAIESGCTKGDTQALYHYFPHSITKDKLKPTNAEFIAVMGDVVKKRVSKRQLVFADI